MTPAPAENNAMDTGSTDSSATTPVAGTEDAHRLLRAVIQGERLTQEETGVVFAALGAGDHTGGGEGPEGGQEDREPEPVDPGLCLGGLFVYRHRPHLGFWRI